GRSMVERMWRRRAGFLALRGVNSPDAALRATDADSWERKRGRRLRDVRGASSPLTRRPRLPTVPATRAVLGRSPREATIASPVLKIAEAPPEPFASYIPAEAKLAEFTPRAVIVGALLGMVFGASSLYLVLKVGLTVSASIPVAVISITLFRLLS